jgi:hypothetical protein
MDKLSSRILTGVKPDLLSYNTVLECWSRLWGDGRKRSPGTPGYYD